MAYNGALIGFGQVAEAAHLPALRERPALSIAAVAEASPARREAAARAFPRARLYDSLEDLLAAERGLDFAVIATPPFLHGTQALECLSAGLSVLCEKPLALDPAEFTALKQRAAESRRALLTVHNWAFAPQWQQVFDLAASGAAGEISEVEIVVERTKPAAGALPGDWRREARLSGGGILVDHGWHALYLVHRLLGGAYERLELEAWEAAPGGAEELVRLRLRYPKALARLSLSWRSARRANTAFVAGARGAIDLRDDFVTLRAGGASKTTPFLEKLSAGSAHPAWLAALLPSFEAALKDPAQGRANLDEAEFCCRVIREAYALTATAAAR